MPQCQMSKEYVLDIGHIDGRGIARPSAVIDFMQDLATRHAGELGLSEQVEAHNGFWVLSRLKYKLSRPLYSYETVRLTTWPRQIKGVSWYRDFLMQVGDDVIGSAATMWAVVDMKTHRLIRPNTLQIPFSEQIVGDPEMLKAIHTDQLKPCFDRVVRYSDIDVNHHLNNVKAVDILSDAFGLEDDETRWVSQMQVNYLSETTCGTKLTLARGTSADGKLCVAALDGDSENVQSEVVFSTL